MLKYTKMYYDCIAQRLKDYRKKNNMTQEQLAEAVGMDSKTVSKIEVKKVVKEKNPYLLSREQIKRISKQMNHNGYEFIWGNEKERENIVKIIILAILMNGSKINPFIYFKDKEKDKEKDKDKDENINLIFFRWAVKQKSIPHLLHAYLLTAISLLEKNVPEQNFRVYPSSYRDEQIIGNPKSVPELRSETISYFKNEYDFFFCERNVALYEMLTKETEYEEELDILSNLILKQVMYDFTFTKKFIDRLNNYIGNRNYNNHENIDKEIEKFLLNRGEYGNIALDYTEYDYSLFINAFNKFWNRHKQDYMNYFSEKIFQNEELMKSSLKHFQDKDFDSIIKSEEFIEMNNKIAIIQEYTEPEALLSQNYIRLSFQTLIHKHKCSSSNVLYECLSNSVIDTNKCAKKILNN